MVVGAGFIGLEMAENLQKAWLSVTVIEQLNQVMNTVDYPMVHGASLFARRSEPPIG